MKTMLSKTHLIAAAVIATAFTAGFASGPAFADKKSEQFTFDFSYEKAELTSSDTAAKLLTRLESKVKRFCAAQAPTGTRMKKGDPECFKRTMQTTVDGFGSSMVAELYKSRADG
jgi:UrcA family protein